MAELDLDTARWLVSEPGLDVVRTATAALDDGRDELVLGTRLRDRGLDPSRAAAVMAAAIARRRARRRWPRADELLFTREALEQASDPEVSAWRARRYWPAPVWDLCAGVGGDALALATRTAEVTALDHDPARLVLLEHNARVLDRRVTTVVADARDLTAPPGVLVHADPARRRGEHRARSLAEHHPPVGELMAVLGAAEGAGVVLSPAVALDDPDLPRHGELELIQLDGRLVEAVVWTRALRRDGAEATATLLPSGETRSRGRRGPQLPVGSVGDLVVEVAPAAVRARLHDEIGAQIAARRLATHRALLTVDVPPPSSPWYVARAVETVLPARPAAVRRWLRGAGERPIEIALHGVDIDPATWWRALGRPPRGPRGRRIELVRTDRGALAVVCDATGTTMVDPDDPEIAAD